MTILFKHTTNIYPKRYFNLRLFNKDTRFASNIEYIFFAQYYTKVKQRRVNISIALRKGLNSEAGKTAGDLKNPKNIKKKYLIKMKDSLFWSQSEEVIHTGARALMICLPWLDSLIFLHFSVLLLQLI